MSLAWFALVAHLVVPVTAPDLSVLTKPQREVFDRVAREEFCSCSSSLTLLGCMETRPDCGPAKHLSSLLVRASQTGLTADEVLGFFSSRISGPFCGKPRKLALTEAPARGPKDAPITLVEFADFRCGHCRQAAPEVKKALSRWSKHVRFVFAPFPLQNASPSVNAALALLAAGRQNKTWEMYEQLFATEDFEERGLMAAAKKVGLDVKRFATDLKDPALLTQVNAIKQQGVEAGVEATPTFFVNGRAFEPDPELFTFGDRFEMELDRASGRCQ
jgi:hypothetical protein